MSLSKTINTRASSGSFYDQFREGYRVQISWSVNSQNVNNNTSNVTVKAQLVSTGSAYTISSSASKSGSLTINGTKYTFTFTAGLSGNQTKTVFTKTVDVPHNSDGTKKLSMSAVLGINVTLSGKYWGNVDVSGTGTLNTIPRTSTFTLSASSVTLGNAITVNINKASSGFAHKVWYKFGSLNVNTNSGTGTAYSFTRGVSDASQIPNSTSGTATVTVETYTDSNYTTKIGSNSKTLTINVPSSVKPTLTSITATVVADGADTSYGYVKGKSKCKLTINGATGANGSTIKSYSITSDLFSSTSSSFTTGTLTKAGKLTFTATVTDSRGRKSDAKTVAITVTDYTNPNLLSFSVDRCVSGGTLNDDGTHLKATTKFTYTKLSGKNTIANKIEFKPTSSSTWTNAGAITVSTTGDTDVATCSGSLVFGNGGISVDQSFDVRLTLTDKFGNVAKTVVIPTAFVTMDIKRGGKGIAFGKASETDNLLDVGMNAQFRNSVKALNGVDVRTSLNGMTAYNGTPVGLSTMESSTADAGNPIQYGTTLSVKHSDFRQFQLFARNSAEGLWYRVGHSDATGGTSTGWSSWFRIYNTSYKPTAKDVGALPTSGGTVTGNTTFNRGSSTQAVVVHTQGDSNADGDGQTHLGYYSNGVYNHYFRGKGTTIVDTHGGLQVNKGSINCSKNINATLSMYIGNYDDTWRGFIAKRKTDSKNYEGRYGVSYGNIKLTSSSTSTMTYGAVIESHDTSSAQGRYLCGNTCFTPLSDNNKQCGTSSHRWSALYASTGTVYSSSKDEKDGIVPLDLSTYGARNLNYKDLIKEGIKNTPMYSYRYKAVNNNDEYVGFLGQELEQQNKPFFDLIGSSYETEEGKYQYDIRETSVIGVLWSGLQDALNENEEQGQKISELENQVENLTNELKQIKDMLSKTA